ncbi:fibronectin type III domain-containing protein [Flavobacterium sp. RSB2_4_14]|uniref:fibronectin type III domain-containing protein n=1 Tax=Flavobacterium sp. RSB2_4_14 TaxID=3447665 RepID=UPI003F340E6D
MANQFCKLEFHKYGASRLDTFTSQVKNGIYTNPTVFVTPPVSEGDFSRTQETFNAAAADYTTYGITKKTAYLNAKNNLLEELDSLAAYVDTTADGDVSIIALSGFEPSKETYQRATPLDKIETFLLKRTNVAGQIIIEIPVISNKGTVNYCCVCSEGVPIANPELSNGQIILEQGDPQVRQDFNKSRRKVFNGLTPGTVYYFYVFATNTVSVSPISDPKNLMAA